MSPAELFHIAEADDWDRADDHYRPASLRDEGFIHLSRADQLPATARRHYRGRTGLLVLTVDVAGLDREALRWEAAPHGEDYPHFYGPLPVASVTDVRAWPE